MIVLCKRSNEDIWMPSSCSWSLLMLALNLSAKLFFFFPLYRKNFDQASLGLLGRLAVLVGINTYIMTQQKEMGLLHEWCLFFTMYNSWVFYSFYWMCLRKWSICLFAFQELSDNMAFLMPCSIFLYFFLLSAFHS